MNNLEINHSFNLTKNHLKVISEFSLFVGAGGGQSGPEKLEGNENKFIGWADIF